VALHSYVYSRQRQPAHRDRHSFPTRRSSDLGEQDLEPDERGGERRAEVLRAGLLRGADDAHLRLPADAHDVLDLLVQILDRGEEDRKSTRLNSSHVKISYAVFCLNKKKH